MFQQVTGLSAKPLNLWHFLCNITIWNHGGIGSNWRGDKIMYFNRYKLHPAYKEHYVYARDKFFYHLRWNILPVAVMLILLGWMSLQAGKMIDESKLSTNESVGQVG
jgi:hypothetical protein